MELIEIEALDGSKAYVNPEHVAVVAGLRGNDGLPIVGSCVIVFAPPTVQPIQTRGNTADVRAKLTGRPKVSL